METTTQPHRQTLRRICTLSQVAGWAMIAMGVLGVGGTAYAGLVAHIGTRGILFNSMDAVGDILTGLVVLGMAQFIRYVVEEDTEPRWLLRNGHIILCLLALSLFLSGSLHVWPQMWRMWEIFLTSSPKQMIPMGREIGVASTTVILLLPPITRALCVLGIAAMLRTVLPILGESKTLV